MASNPPAKCCYEGFDHNGQPQGTILMLEDFEVYISTPKDGANKYGILILTDVIGHRFINAQLIADQFAERGYLVMMPDLFYGNPVPLNRPGSFDMEEWRKGAYSNGKKAHMPVEVDPIVGTCVAEMKAKGCVKIAAAGYCFGAKYVVRHLLPGRIDVGYIAHPSRVDADELRGIQGPLAIAAAEVDKIFPPTKRHESEDILKSSGLPYQINLYGGVQHGFAVRGDPNNKTVEYAKRNAFYQAAGWFEEHLV